MSVEEKAERLAKRHAADEKAAKLASRQHGLLTRAQAIKCGIKSPACQARVRRGRWESVHPGVYRLPGALKTREQEILAACLAVDGTASHTAAATILGFPDIRCEVAISVDRRRGPRLKGVTLYRVRPLERADKAWVNGIPVTSVTRTVIDLASVLEAKELERVVDHVLANRRAPLAYVKARLLALGIRGRKGGRTLADILAIREGLSLHTDSEPQRELDRLLAAHGLPPGVSEHPVPLAGGRVRHVDKGWPDHHVVLQIDSYQHHSTLRDHTSDITRDNEVALQGLRVLRVTPEQISREPDAVAALVRGALGIASEDLAG